tara:strand:- start:699 stop:1196 length:498 start_codon:yes stop_codon:yes gene_type:complete
MAEKGIELLKAFGKEPTLPATSADFQIKLSYAQFVDVVESALNVTDGGTITGPLTTNSSFTLGNIQSAAATDSSHYTINGSRGEIRSQLQGGVAADTGWTVTLINSSIEANSLVVANVIGGFGSIVTGSVVSANVVGPNSASFNFFNTGVAIPDNSVFTASFAVL